MFYSMQKPTNEKKDNRLSNFELLRIISMIIIIAHHFSVHGGFDFPTNSITIPRLWIQFIQIGGKIGVNIFILISGYFLIHSTKIKTIKLLKLWLQLFTYSVMIYIIFVVLGFASFNKKVLLKSFLPVAFGNWWFANSYFVLYILSPFINKYLTSLDKKTFQKLLMTLLVLWCLIPTLTNRNFEGNGLSWFICVYAISAYIRLWNDEIKIPYKRYAIFAFTLIFLIFASAVLLDFVSLKVPFFSKHTTHFYEMQSLPILLISIFIFLCFKGIDMHYKKIINLISTATFGVYLIHDNIYVRSFLWLSLFKNREFADTLFIIPYSIGVIVLVFIVCTCIELIRIFVFEKHYMKVVLKIEPVINNRINRILDLDVFDKLL